MKEFSVEVKTTNNIIEFVFNNGNLLVSDGIRIIEAIRFDDTDLQIYCNNGIFNITLNKLNNHEKICSWLYILTEKAWFKAEHIRPFIEVVLIANKMKINIPAND